jgi:hypothetical protein
MFIYFKDGNWGSWSAWASCSATCGGGTQARTRVCDSPAPLYGGTDCAGSGAESQTCNNAACPVSKYFGIKAPIFLHQHFPGEFTTHRNHVHFNFVFPQLLSKLEPLIQLLFNNLIICSLSNF